MSFLGEVYVVVVQSLNRVRLFVAPWTVAHQASLSISHTGYLVNQVHIQVLKQSCNIVLDIVFCSMGRNLEQSQVNMNTFYLRECCVSAVKQEIGLLNFRIHIDLTILQFQELDLLPYCSSLRYWMALDGVPKGVPERIFFSAFKCTFFSSPCYSKSFAKQNA